MRSKKVKSRKSYWALALLPVIPLMMAPAPGEVGGCGGSDGEANAQAYCDDVQTLECYRSNARGEFADQSGLSQCLANVARTCQAVSWPCLTPPTVIEARACTDALRQQANLALSREQIPACASICADTAQPAPQPASDAAPMTDGGV